MFVWLGSAGLEIPLVAAAVEEKELAHFGQVGDGYRWYARRGVWFERLWLLLSSVLSWQQLRDGHS